MKITTNQPLLKYNTFGVNVSAKFFALIDSIDDLLSIIQDNNYSTIPILVLGGGSNILFTQDFDGIVLKNNLKGISVVDENENEIILEVGAGENWHDFVSYCVKLNYGGLENLSLIPGNVGASPMQNIGAYGVEIKDSVRKVKFIDLKSGLSEELNAEQCEFGYRSSIFKTRYKDQKFITHVRFKLNKKPVFNTSYGAIEEELKKLDLEHSVENISRAVINIRRSKLPDPAMIGNAGSFFKNPVISFENAEKLKAEFPEVPLYPAGDSGMKVAAGWLIEKAGWKGRRINNFGVHEKQALVLVNYGGSQGSEIDNLAEQIRQNIKEKFGVELEKEVNIL